MALRPHQLAIPLALHSISPTLSAFHIDRARRRLRSGGEEEEKEGDRSIDVLDGTHCPRCRRFQLDGSADTRLVRANNNHRSPSSVILQKTCRSCGFVRRTPLEKHPPVVFQNRRKRNRQHRNLKPPGTTLTVDTEGETQSTARMADQSPPITPLAQPSLGRDHRPKKSKNKKARPGLLQEMLERKRRQDRVVESAGTSLASFLQGL